MTGDYAPTPRNGKENQQERSRAKTYDQAQNRESQNNADDKYCTPHGKGNHSTSDCFTLKRKANKLKKDNPEKFRGKKTNEMMTILNNVVTKMSTAGTKSQQAVEEEIKNFENLTVSSDDGTNDFEDLEELFNNELEEGEIESANSDLHE